MVIAHLLIYIVTHAGIENRINTFINQGLNVSMHQLCWIADGIGGYRMLSFRI